MAKPKLSLQVPVDHTISINSTEGTSDPLLHGQVSFNNIPQQCDIHIALARVGRLSSKKETRHEAASTSILSELGFMKEQNREHFDYETAEKLCGCLISPPKELSESKTVKCNFGLQVPSYLPATTSLPSVDISYAIFATCILPNGKVLQTKQNIHIERVDRGIIHLETSRKVSFPETSFAVRVKFNTPDFGTKDVAIPTTLQLEGLQLPSNDSTRATETRWLVPREIKWELEETAVIVTGFPDATGHIPMSTAQRVLKKCKLASGGKKLKPKYPFTRTGDSHAHMGPDGTSMEVPFTVTAPKNISLGDSTALSVAGGHVMHTVLSCDTPHMPQKRFAVYLEYKLHVWLRIGEDVFDQASGDLVNRKMDEMAYTVVCPLTAQQCADITSTDSDEEPAPIVPPLYDGVWEQPPPGYMPNS
ncbi:hypothetical protein C7974DRAFT_408339 [Boeremia exigua]|uniref:uncharacterized protein n=1 Tax=Boeremia exigua TaxID=749465 RepID=UPI001E8D03AF|nr:uncharacterized protein C7974DRAFT_408339 [Boeremia exigua]KAH6644677.1 hypothetical protein C7974DRAFT_408339 [Boeremia exigua]